MRMRDRRVTMTPPIPGETREFYQGSEGWKYRPNIGEEIVVADVGGTGKIALGRVISHDKKAHTFAVLILRDYKYDEDENS